MDPDNSPDMQRADNSLENNAADGDHHTRNPQSAATWTSPLVSRPPPHDVAGKVARTIFHWERNTWQHKHEGPLFDWGLLKQLNLRVSCSLPPPPISRPFHGSDCRRGHVLKLLLGAWSMGARVGE